MEQEPGSAGVAVVDRYLRLLAGFVFRSERSTGDKMTRALPLAAQAEGGLVKLVRGPWNEAFLDEASAFPYGPHDDMVDAAAMALQRLVTPSLRGELGPICGADTPGYHRHVSPRQLRWGDGRREHRPELGGSAWRFHRRGNPCATSSTPC
jgi:hypothetical protein